MNDGSGFQKRRQLLEMLDAGLVMLHIDPRPPEVIVPARFKTEPVLRLNLAYQFRLPALDVGAEGVYAVLSFDRQNFGCTLPWSSIFAVTRPNDGHDGVVWPESVPAELKASFAHAGVNEPTRLRQVTPGGGTNAARMEVIPAAVPAVAPVAAVQAVDAVEAADPIESVPVEAIGQPGSARPSGIEAVAAVGASAEPEGDAPPEPIRRRGHLTLIKG